MGVGSAVRLAISRALLQCSSAAKSGHSVDQFEGEKWSHSRRHGVFVGGITRGTQALVVGVETQSGVKQEESESEG